MASSDVNTEDAENSISSRNKSSSSGNAISDENGGYGVCLVKFGTDAVGGAVMGSVYGFGYGLLKRSGLKGSLKEAGISAKTLALFSGVQSLVLCLMRKFRGKDDVYNFGIAGCATGLAISIPGPPQTLVQGCVMWGAFSLLIELANKNYVAKAQDYSSANPLKLSKTNLATPISVLPPFTLPPFCLEGLSKMLPQSKKRVSRR